MMMLTVMIEGKSRVKVHGMYTTNARPVLKMGQEKKSHKAVIINRYGWRLDHTHPCKSENTEGEQT